MDTTEYVKDFMTKKLITFTPDMEIKTALKTLLGNKISGAPVVDASGKLVGMLSEKDCIRLLVDGYYNQRPAELDGKLESYMSRNLKTIQQSATMMEIAIEFANSNYRRLPVLDGEKLVGQISRRDVLRCIDQHRPKVEHVPSTWKARMPAQ